MSDEVSVKPAGGGPIQPLQVPKGYSEVTFRNAIGAAYQGYLEHGRIPTAEECHDLWGRISTNTFAELFLTEEFQQAMRNRGITDWDEEASLGISYEQSMALSKLTNPLDKRSDETKLKELGIPYVQLVAWRKNPVFARLEAKRAEDGLREHVPAILNRLVGKAEAGNIQAMDRVLAMTGRYDPNNREVIVVQELLMTLLRIIATRIPDTELKSLLADDIMSAAGDIISREQAAKQIGR